MNNQEKSKLDIVSGDSVVIEQSPVIEVEPEKLEIFQNSGLTVLIKHDYYSSDSAHGRELLGAFLVGEHGIGALVAEGILSHVGAGGLDVQGALMLVNISLRSFPGYACAAGGHT